MNKFAVYTVVTGGFDTVQQPLVIDKRFDYILFVDEPQSANIGVWQARPIGYSHPDARQRSRFPKVHPEICLADYEASLYIDGNIQITSQWVYDRCVELYDSGTEWAGVKHSCRNSLYEEMDFITREGWVHDYDVLSWFKFIQTQGYDKQINDALGYIFENGIIFRHHTENTKNVNELWWWTLENYVRRDQFSLMYALWKVPAIKTDFLLPKQENIYENAGHFIYVKHNPHVRILPMKYDERLRRGIMKVRTIPMPYIQMFDTLSKYQNTTLAFKLWTICATLRYGHRIVLKKLKKVL